MATADSPGTSRQHALVISIDTRREPNKRGPKPIKSSAEWRALHETYYMQGFTLLDIAVLAYCDRETVARNFRLEGLEIRGQGRRSTEAVAA